VLALRAGGALGAASLAVLAVYTAAVTWTLFGSASLFRLRTYAAGICWKRLALAAGAFVAIRIALVHASTAPGMTLSRHLRHVLLYNSGRPGLFLIAHAVYFGPVALLLLLSWSRVAATAHRLGLGITAYVVFHFLHGINTESRQLIDGLPLYVLLATLAATERGLAAGHVWLVAAVGLLTSKFWLLINQGMWGEASRFPAQLYFMNMGPSMTSATLGLQAAGVLLTLGLFWAALPRAASTANGSSAGRPRVADL